MDGGELAHDAVDARAHGQELRFRLEVKVGRALVDRPRDEGVDAVDGRCARRGMAGGIGRRAGVGVSALPDGDRALVDAVDRRHDVRCGRHGEAHVEPEGEAEVVGGEDVRRVGDGDEDELVAQEADREGLVAARVLLRQQPRHLGVDLHRAEIEVLEVVLLGQEPGHVAGGDPAPRDDDLADPVPASILLGERLLELLGREHALAQEQRADLGALRRLRVQGEAQVPTGPQLSPRSRSIGLRCSRHEVRLPAGRRGAGAGRRRGGGRDRAGALRPARGRRRRRRDRGGPAGRQDRPAAGLRGRGGPLRPGAFSTRAARRSSSPSSRSSPTRRRATGRASRARRRPIGRSRSTSASARSCARSAFRSSRASSARGWTSSS